MSIMTSCIMTSFQRSKLAFNARPASPARVNATPSNSAKTIICSMLPSAMAATGLLGKISNTTCVNGGASFAWNVIPSAILMPSPGLMIFATVNASVIAIAVVIKYSATVFSPIRPILFPPAKLLAPHTKDTKTRGTTSSFSVLIKICPPRLKIPPTRNSPTKAFSDQSKP